MNQRAQSDKPRLESPVERASLRPRQVGVCRTFSKEHIMYESDETTTVAITPCRSCGAGLMEGSRFCRSCGIAQSQSLRPEPVTMIADGNVAPSPRYATTTLSPQKLYHPVSGPLVNAVVAGVPANLPRSPAGSLSKRMLLALMAIPIWLMIILLSPLDAYTS